ncbi:hypothetical protein ES705_05989 [subsurface metagenome]
MAGFSRITIYLLSLIVILSSCGKLAVFTKPYDETTQIEIRSLEEGGVLNKNDTVSFVIHSAQKEEQDITLMITLCLHSGEVIWDTSLEAPLLNEELDLLLPELETGHYILKFTAASQTGSSSERTVNFFYVEGSYRILGITSYPPIILPQTYTMLKAELSIPDDSNPYIRWSQDGNLIAQGSLAQGLDKINWPAPNNEGIYTILVELFPFAPPQGNEYSFRSGTTLNAELYILSHTILQESDLQPESSYFSLFHFNGDLKDSGAGSKEKQGTVPAAELEVIGNPTLVTIQDTVGYRLAAADGFRLPRLILPVKDGLLLPFTLTMGLLTETAEPGGELINVRSKDDSLNLVLFFDSSGNPAVKIRIVDQEIIAPSHFTDFNKNQEHFISLSVLPREDHISIQWFLDGYQSTASVFKPAAKKIAGQGETIIAGTELFSGVVTELGVYFQDSQKRATINPAIYSQAMHKKHRHNLIYAQGFDGTFLSDELSSQGDIKTAGGFLVLSGAASLQLPTLAMEERGLHIELIFEPALTPESRIALLWEKSDDPFITIAGNGLISLPNGAEHNLPALKTERSLTISLSPQDEETMKVVITAGVQSSELILPSAGAAADLKLKLACLAPDDKPLIIDRITVLHNN